MTDPHGTTWSAQGAGVRLSHHAGAGEKIECEAITAGTNTQLFADGVERHRKHGTRAIGDAGPHLGSEGVYRSLELGVVQTPTCDRLARKADALGDAKIGHADGDELHGARLLRGNSACTTIGQAAHVCEVLLHLL